MLHDLDGSSQGRDTIVSIAERVNSFQIQHQVILSSADSNDFVSRPRFGLVEVVYEWARGMSFHLITDLTDVLEGTIVRTITRLDETCREVKNAARIIGDPALFTKMQTCQEMIKRDITAVASLYVDKPPLHVAPQEAVFKFPRLKTPSCVFCMTDCYFSSTLVTCEQESSIGSYNRFKHESVLHHVCVVCYISVRHSSRRVRRNMFRLGFVRYSERQLLPTDGRLPFRIFQIEMYQFLNWSNVG